MGFGALRTLIRPLLRTLISRTSTMTPFPSTSTFSPLNLELRFAFGGPSPMVSDPQPFPLLDRHSIPKETAKRKVSSQKSQHENARAVCLG
ncbi:hypothetical protein SO802_017132 [Lithocarpus litseifolius]|uniref:Uncharacterized protein n=1 Tax=Lithocarpus litseifolius TaxID=425828 RepID=A0AAW2D3U4_9ROSI